MQRTIFESEHEDFRQSFRTFLEREIVPHAERWDAAGIVDTDAFRAAGRAGFLAFAVPERWGGAGIDDFRFNLVQAEEVQRAQVMNFGMGLGLHNDLCLPYLLEYATDEQKDRWLPGVVSGELLPAIVLTEPGAGSDLAGISTAAIRDGDEYVVNGAKTFISSGINANLLITALKTRPDERHRGMSLLVIESDTPGFSRARSLRKIGLIGQDTAELAFQDARVPVGNLLGREGEGFRYLTANLPQERLSIAGQSIACAREALGWTVDYVRERQAFGKTLADLQTVRFTLAELTTEVDVAQAFLDRCVELHVAGALTPVDAAKAKWWCSELQGRVVDRCLQLFGGYGYTWEYPIARAYVDARISRIYGGATEIMKEIIGRDVVRG